MVRFIAFAYLVPHWAQIHPRLCLHTFIKESPVLQSNQIGQCIVSSFVAAELYTVIFQLCLSVCLSDNEMDCLVKMDGLNLSAYISKGLFFISIGKMYSLMSVVESVGLVFIGIGYSFITCRMGNPLKRFQHSIAGFDELYLKQGILLAITLMQFFYANYLLSYQKAELSTHLLLIVQNLTLSSSMFLYKMFSKLLPEDNDTLIFMIEELYFRISLIAQPCFQKLWLKLEELKVLEGACRVKKKLKGYFERIKKHSLLKEWYGTMLKNRQEESICHNSLEENSTIGVICLISKTHLSNFQFKSPLKPTFHDDTAATEARLSVKKSNQEIAKLNHEVRQSTVKMEKVESEVFVLSKQIREMNESLCSMKNSNKTLSGQNFKLVKDISSQQATIERLKGEVKKQKNEKNEIKRTSEMEKSKIQEMKLMVQEKTKIIE